MSYILQNVLHIRCAREDKASADLAEARTAVRNAMAEVEQQELILKDYEKTKNTRRDRLYNAVIGKVITHHELDLLQEGIARIDDEGVLKANNVDLAKEKEKEKEDEEILAHSYFIEASKNRMKLTEHRNFWSTEQLRIEDYHDELEMEDFTSKKGNETYDECYKYNPGA